MLREVGCRVLRGRWWWCKGKRLWAFNKSRRQLIYPRRGVHVTDADDALVAVRAPSLTRFLNWDRRL